MPGKNFSLLFYLKRPKNYLNGDMPIYMRITVDGLVKELTTSRKCHPEIWDQKSEKAYGKGEYIKELNNHLSTLKVKVFEARLLLIETNKQVTADGIKNTLIGKVEKSKTVLEVFKNHNEQLEALVGSEYSPATLRRYKISFGHTLSFIKWKYNLDDFEINKVNYEFLTDYVFWLKTVRKCNHNTSMKYVRNFRKIVNGSIRRGWLTRDPFWGFKMSMEAVKITPLSKEELKALSEKEFSCERLNQVKVIFLFCCFTGLAYVDIKKLKRTEIVIGIDEEKWIFTNSSKNWYCIPDTYSAKSTLNLFKMHKKTAALSNFLNPTFSKWGTQLFF